MYLFTPKMKHKPAEKASGNLFMKKLKATWKKSGKPEPKKTNKTKQFAMPVGQLYSKPFNIL